MPTTTINIVVEIVNGLIVLGSLALAGVFWQRSRLAAGIAIAASLVTLLGVGIGLFTGFVVDPMVEEGRDLSTAMVITSLVEGVEYGFHGLGLFLMLLAVVVDRPQLAGQAAGQKEPAELVMRVSRQVLPPLMHMLAGRTGRNRLGRYR